MRDNLLRMFYRRCARVLYIGRRSLRHYQRLGVPEEKLAPSPYCVDTEPFSCDEAARLQLRGTTRSELGLREKDVVLMFSGKISKRKGPDLLLGAVRELPSELRERTCLCFVGDGELRASLQSAAEAIPPVRVLFLGFQKQSTLSRYYHAADALVLPSRWGETWGLVVNEALHHGMPCVVSDAVGCAPDLILPGITGHTFEAGVSASLAAALTRSMGLMDRADVRDACRRHVSGYSVIAAARGIAAAYAQITHS